KEGNESATSSQSKDKGQAARDQMNQGGTKKSDQTGAADRMKGQHQNQTTEEKEKGGSSARSTPNEPGGQTGQRESGKTSAGPTSGESKNDMKSSEGAAETTGKNEGAKGGIQGHNATTNESHMGGNTQGMSGANFTAEQRTKIRETVLSGNNVPRVNRVDFAM